MSKIKCDLKKIAKRPDGKIYNAVTAKSLNVFDLSEDEEQNVKYGTCGKHEKFGKENKAEIVKGMKNGEIVVVDIDKDKPKNPQDVVSLNFINNLENKLSRVNNKRKIIYLNFPSRSNEIYSNENKKKRIDVQNEDTSVHSPSSCSASVGSSKDMAKKEEKNSSEKGTYITHDVTECEKRTSVLGIEKRNQNMESRDIDNSEKKESEESEKGEESESDIDSIFNDPDILPNFLTSPPKENANQEFLLNENESLCTKKDHLNSSSNNHNDDDNNNNNNSNSNNHNSNYNNDNYSNCSNNNNMLPESSLAFKRKQFLEKINKKEEEVIFKKELNLYKDFKKHNIEIENYGKHILSKMGYDEKIYNTYINKYYNESGNSNYFDKIYEQFQVRSFRFTGIGAEEEMEENLAQIKAEGEILTNKKNVTGSTKPAKETSCTKKESKVKNKSKVQYKDNDKDKDRDRNKDRDRGRDRDKEKDTERKKQKYGNYVQEEGERRKNENCKSSQKRENETDVTYSCNEEDNEHKKQINQDLFEGLIVKINLKTHEHYKRKGIIIFKKRRKNEVYYGLLLFKNYGLVDSYKKKIKNKIEEVLDEKCTDVKYFWIRVIKELNKTVLLEKEEKKYDTDEIRKKIIDYFDVTEVKGKYLETVIKSDCSKCKIVSTHLQHPRKKTSIYKETVELIKIKPNSSCAYVKLRKKYELKVSLDDICECISYSVGS